jgi:Mpv17 / PMP22 family
MSSLQHLFLLLVVLVISLPRHAMVVDAFVPPTGTTEKTLTTAAVPGPPRLQDLVRKLPAAYAHCLTHHALATECLTTGCMAGLGDYLAQRAAASGGVCGTGASHNNSTSHNASSISSNSNNSAAVPQSGSKKKPRVGHVLDWKRSLTFFFKGLGEGLMWSFWYHQSDKVLQRVMSSLVSSQWILVEGSPAFLVIRTVLALVTDLFIACPIIYASWDIPIPALVKGTPFRKIPRQIRIKLPEMMMASTKLWMPANIIIYNAPLKYRVLLMSLTDVFWQSMVSTIATRDIVDDPLVALGPDGMEEGIALLSTSTTTSLMDSNSSSIHLAHDNGNGTQDDKSTTSNNHNNSSSVTSFINGDVGKRTKSV